MQAGLNICSCCQNAGNIVGHPKKLPLVFLTLSLRCRKFLRPNSLPLMACCVVALNCIQDNHILDLLQVKPKCQRQTEVNLCGKATIKKKKSLISVRLAVYYYSDGMIRLGCGAQTH